MKVGEAALIGLAGILFHCSAAEAQAQVVISEIMYHPVEEPTFQPDGTPVMDLSEDVHEYIELHNPTRNTVAMSSWEITGGIHYIFPVGASIEPGGYRVVAKNKARLAAIAEYGLTESAVWGPYEGQLGNRGETIRLRRANRETADSVQYSATFPWAISADALGAGEEWTGIRELDHQYRGRSLERVGFSARADDPANWLASPWLAGPSPGRPNAVKRDVPKPIVINLRAADATNGQALITKDRPVRIDCLFSSTESLSGVTLQYFIDDVETTNESRTRLAMFTAGHPREGRFTVELPGFPDRCIVRYRIIADRGEGIEVISPRPDDPFAWHAFFVTPARGSTNPVYDLFISTNSLQILRTNISQTPRRTTRPDPPGLPRASWNATEPAVFVCNGVVYDVRMRHHGSQYGRFPGLHSYEIQFPPWQLFNEQRSLLVTGKNSKTADGHAIFREVGLPTARTRWVDLYMNSDPKLVRLELEEYDESMLKRFRDEQCRLHPDRPVEEPGDLFKAVGDFSTAGPYGPADGKQLPPRVSSTVVFWSSLQRYEWSYALQDHKWRGHTEFKDMNLHGRRSRNRCGDVWFAGTRDSTRSDSGWRTDSFIAADAGNSGWFELGGHRPRRIAGCLGTRQRIQSCVGL